ncbi:hypothetical protein Ntsu_67180 [Nocardia sp. IFM 10818]
MRSVPGMNFVSGVFTMGGVIGVRGVSSVVGMVGSVRVSGHFRVSLDRFGVPIGRNLIPPGGICKIKWSDPAHYEERT